MNKVYVHYCYPTSDMAERLGKPAEGGFYVQLGGHNGTVLTDRLYKSVEGAEGFCRNNGLTWERHGYIPKADSVRKILATQT